MSPSRKKIATRLASPAPLVKELAVVMTALLRLDQRRNPLAKREEELRSALLDGFKRAELDGLRAHGLELAVVATAVPTVADWDAFIAFARRKGNDDLLQRRVMGDACRERLAAGHAVPGVTIFNRLSLRVSRA